MALLDEARTIKKDGARAYAETEPALFASRLAETYDQKAGSEMPPFRPRLRRRWPWAWRRGVRREFVESFRLLALSIDKFVAGKQKTILVMSERRGEGRTVVAANLALAMAAERRRVVVVDAHRGAAGVAKLLELPNAGPGIQGVPDAPYVAVATLDSAGSNALPLLEAVRAVSDVTVIDAPPNVGHADAFLLAANVDGIVLVVRRREQDLAAQRRTHDLLARLGTPIVAVVFNDT
jgi:Mrp family chromosome partitioning ATPase